MDCDSSLEPSRTRSGRRVRRGPRSLLSKLTIGVVSLVVVLVLVISAATYFSLRAFLDSRLDDQLSSTATQNAGFFDKCLANPIIGETNSYRCPFSGVNRKEWVGALNPDDGQYVTFSSADTSDIQQLKLTSEQQRRLGTLGPDDAFTTYVDGVKLRVKADRSRSGLIVATGLPTDEVTRTLRRLVVLELVIGGAAVVLAMAATAFGVRFSLRRLHRVTATAESVARELSPEGTGLDRRVPDDEPDTEVGQLATSFNTMLAAVETQFAARLESEQRMRQFLADASHELRTPLTSIRGYAELARMQRSAGTATSDANDNLDRIEFEGLRMSRLVEDLLMLARGDDTGDDRTPERHLIDIAGLIDDAIRGSRVAFPEREIVVDTSDPSAYVIGDPHQLLQVVRNLVNNAAVHTAPDRPIRVGASGDGATVTITVADGGPGLTPEDAAHVFERFWRADKARTRARGGSGLGMSIVASIVSAHGGSVRFESTVEAGSTVTVRLPAVQHG